jgi:sugar lactone lactonase YvrE
MNSRIQRLGLQLTAAIAFMASLEGCSVWVLGVVQSLGSQNGPKISTIAGNGTGGSGGDGGPATSAKLNQPYDIAIDSSGNIYIADCNNSLIRMVNTSGIISTVVSTGLFNPQAVVVDGSNMYIADSGDQVIKEVSITGGIPGAVAGTGTQGSGGSTNLGLSGGALLVDLNYPSGLAVDSSHNLYITDTGNSRILKLSSGGTLSLFAGSATGAPGYTGDSGPATAAHLNYPNAIALDTLGNMYVADGLNFVIRKIDLLGTIGTIAGNGVNGDSGDGGPALAGEIEQPYGVAIDSSRNLYISQLNSVVRKVDTNGIMSTVAGNAHLGAGYGGDGNVATAAMLDEPWGLAIDLSGNLLIADRINNRIRKVAFGK